MEPLLRGRAVWVIYTQNSPWLAGMLFRGDLFWQWINRAVLRHRHASDKDRDRILQRVRELGRLGI